MPASMGIQI